MVPIILYSFNVLIGKIHPWPMLRWVFFYIQELTWYLNLIISYLTQLVLFLSQRDVRVDTNWLFPIDGVSNFENNFCWDPMFLLIFQLSSPFQQRSVDKVAGHHRPTHKLKWKMNRTKKLKYKTNNYINQTLNSWMLTLGLPETEALRENKDIKKGCLNRK